MLVPQTNGALSQSHSAAVLDKYSRDASLLRTLHREVHPVQGSSSPAHIEAQVDVVLAVHLVPEPGAIGREFRFLSPALTL